MTASAETQTSVRESVRAARARLAEPSPRRGSAWALLGAAGLAATSGAALCVAVFLGASELPSARPAPAAVAAMFLAPRG